MKIALAQMRCVVGDVAANCARYRAYAEQAAERGCQALLFPEMSDTGYEPAAIRAHAGAWSDGLAMRTLRECAVRHGLYILAGLSEREGEAIYNALAVLSPEGALVGRYRKTHLVPLAPCYEDQLFVPGASFARLPIGEFTWGLSICYDLRFPELYRALALGGADVLVNVAAWPARRPRPWEALTQARAIENQAYMLACNRAGADAGAAFCGRSCIVAPSGEAACLGAEEEGLLMGEIDKERIRTERESIPAFRSRRPELYAVES